MKLIILSTYLGQNTALRHRFHFRGYFKGYKVKEVEIISNKSFIKGEDYKLKVCFLGMEKYSLIGELVQHTKIWE